MAPATRGGERPRPPQLSAREPAGRGGACGRLLPSGRGRPGGVPGTGLRRRLGARGLTRPCPPSAAGPRAASARRRAPAEPGRTAVPGQEEERQVCRGEWGAQRSHPPRAVQKWLIRVAQIVLISLHPRAA